MFKWFFRKQKELIQRNGGMKEKREAIDVKNQTAESVTRKMELMRVGGERRITPSSDFFPDSRSGTDRRVRFEPPLQAL